MQNLLRQTGALAGFVGLIICLYAGIARLYGMHWVKGFEVVTLLQIGIGGMVLGCFFLLLALTTQAKRP